MQLFILRKILKNLPSKIIQEFYFKKYIFRDMYVEHNVTQN